MKKCKGQELLLSVTLILAVATLLKNAPLATQNAEPLQNINTCIETEIINVKVINPLNQTTEQQLERVSVACKTDYDADGLQEPFTCQAFSVPDKTNSKITKIEKTFQNTKECLAKIYLTQHSPNLEFRTIIKGPQIKKAIGERMICYGLFTTKCYPGTNEIARHESAHLFGIGAKSSVPYIVSPATYGGTTIGSTAYKLKENHETFIIEIESTPEHTSFNDQKVILTIQVSDPEIIISSVQLDSKSLDNMRSSTFEEELKEQHYIYEIDNDLGFQDEAKLSFKINVINSYQKKPTINLTFYSVAKYVDDKGRTVISAFKNGKPFHKPATLIYNLEVKA